MSLTGNNKRYILAVKLYNCIVFTRAGECLKYRKVSQVVRLVFHVERVLKKPVKYVNMYDSKTRAYVKRYVPDS